MNKMAFPDAWEEQYFISVTKASGSEIQFGPIVDPTTLDFGIPEYPGEGLPNAAGGRIWKQSPQGDIEVTFDIYGIELDATTGVGLFQQFDGGTVVSSDPLASDNAWLASVDKTRDRFRVAVLFTNDPAAATAGGATAASTDSFRVFANNLRITSLKPTFSDGVWKQTVTFKGPVMTKAGTTRNYQFQSGDQTALAALASFT